MVIIITFTASTLQEIACVDKILIQKDKGSSPRPAVSVAFPHRALQFVMFIQRYNSTRRLCAVQCNVVKTALPLESSPSAFCSVGHTCYVWVPRWCRRDQLYCSAGSALAHHHTEHCSFTSHFFLALHITKEQNLIALEAVYSELLQTHPVSKWKLLPHRHRRGRAALCTQFDHLQKWAHTGPFSGYFIHRNISAIICDNSF